MKVAMVFPTRESEKAISGYSASLVDNLVENKVDIEKVTYTAGSPKSFFSLFPKLKEFDIVHIQHEYNLCGYYGIPLFLAYFYFLFFKKYKLVTTMHTALPLNEKFKGGILKNFLRKSLYYLANKLINKASDKIFVHSNFFVPVLMRDYAIPRKKIVALPLGIIRGAKITPKNEAKRKLGLKGHVYLIIGNLHYDNGADRPVKKAAEIGKTILVVSSPIAVNTRNAKALKEHLDFLQNYVKEHQLSKYVRFDIKEISDQMPIWWEYFSAADFVLQAYRGGVGSAIFTHAMATKTPVIASNAPFFLEISKSYDCIRIAKTDDEFPKIIKESLKPKNYAKMLRGCEKYFAENNWFEVAKKYKKVYESLE
ncbi:glycosyltransferase [Candidatus Pacearchaeota archaeon]|nr:glycosyltransferase [Candidatus Pacearchaeota archaeon]